MRAELAAATVDTAVFATLVSSGTWPRRFPDRTIIVASYSDDLAACTASVWVAASAHAGPSMTCWAAWLRPRPPQTIRIRPLTSPSKSSGVVSPGIPMSRMLT
jgi:hypothetical protein